MNTRPRTAAGQRAATRTEVIVVILVCLLLAAIAVPLFKRPREEPILSPTRRCANWLRQIGMACETYVDYSGGYWPAMLSSPAAVQPYATDSMTLLYPEYVYRPDIFACPSTKDRPTIWSDVSRRVSWFGTAQGRSLCRPQDKDKPSYGWDAEIGLRAMQPGTPVTADMASTIHDGGMNVLFWDGHVSLEKSNFCGADPADNIFAIDAKVGVADKDAYIRRP